MERDRGRERPPLPAGDPPGWRRKADPPPLRPSRGYSGERVDEGGKRRSYHTDRERSRERSARELPRDRRSDRTGPKSSTFGGTSKASSGTARDAGPRERSNLGRTSGVAAAGAWAARWEIAALLESRCNPADLVADIKAGKEGEHILKLGAQTSLGGSLRSWSVAKSPERSKAGLTGGAEPERKPKLFDSDSEWDEDLAKQQAILESLGGTKGSGLPAWISGTGSSGSRPTGVPVVGPSYIAPGPMAHDFRKAAGPPPSGTAARPIVDLRSSHHKEARADPQEGLESFQKRATPPPPSREPSEDRRSRGRDRSRRRRRGHKEHGPLSMAQKETQEMEKYFCDSLDIFEILLKKYKVEMELAEIIAPSGKVDVERFRLLTRPKRASTGLNYVRLMERFLSWRRDRPELDKRTGGLDSKMGVLDFVESLIQEQVGYLTPRSFLYSLDYFATAFGFLATGGSWNRAKRLAGVYASSKVTPTSRAPLFTKTTLASLEVAVQDPFLSRPERIACGKLRLCVQASIRFDDLLNTPLNRCEWVRRPGEKTIIGLRSRALRGKTGARHWIAALPGVEPDNDKWLITLMDLVLESHGATWKDDDHFGKMVSNDMVHFMRRPASLSIDVSLVKSALEKYHKEGRPIGLTTCELQILRWHGAKATLSSVMQHLGIREKAVRFQGGWASRAESMPDVYLREAQTLVLLVQQRCLSYLRAGGEVMRLEGIPVSRESGEEAAAGDTQEKDDKDGDEALKAGAMESKEPMAKPADEFSKAFLDDEFDDDLNLSEEVLEKESSVRQEGDNWEECLVDAGDAEDGDSVIRSPTPLKEDPMLAPNLEVNPDEDMDERDSEGLITHWVQAKGPTSKHKVHLPSEETLKDGVAVVVRPKCGISGTFELAKVEDPLEPTASLCKRCLPRSSESGCDGICGHMHLGRTSLVVHRCFRRCCIGEASHEEHKCTLHVDGPEREGQN